MALCLEHSKPQMSQTEQADLSTVSSAGLEVATHLVVPPGFPHSQCPTPRQGGIVIIARVFSPVEPSYKTGIFAVLPEEVPDLLDFFFFLGQHLIKFCCTS